MRIRSESKYNPAAMKKYFKIACFVLFLSALAMSVACGTNTNCALSGVRISPQSATANHNALAPANSQQFTAFPEVPNGCAISQSNLVNATWSVSDPENVSISNAHDLTYGLATCVNATAGPVTVTATAPTGNTTPPCPDCPVQVSVSGTASLTCE